MGGAPVEFEAYLHKGFLQARQLRSPPSNNGLDVGIGYYVGGIKNFNGGKGDGFISCDALRNEENKPDVFFSQKAVGDFQVEPGAPVEFEAFWVKGRLQGRHLQVPADERGDKVLGIFVGVVKSFNSDKGFGFITCDDLENENGKPDVYVHSKLVGDFDMQ